MDSTALQLTLREMRRHLTGPKALAEMAVVAMVLGLAGPFGTYALLPLLPRLVYWLATVFLTYGLGYSLSLYADAAWGKGRPFWFRLTIMALPAGIAATITVTLVNLVSFGAPSFGVGDLAVLLAECLAVAFGVVTIVLLFGTHPAPAAAPQPAPPALPLILERVPLPQRGRLLALVVEDHYVDIVTERGKILVLMRLADAMKETGSVAGLQIHRSHWVASAAVVKTHRANGKLSLELSNGMRLPVSRGFLPAVKAAGLG